jgi:hypothetical protein
VVYQLTVSVIQTTGEVEVAFVQVGVASDEVHVGVDSEEVQVGEDAEADQVGVASDEVQVELEAGAQVDFVDQELV